MRPDSETLDFTDFIPESKIVRFMDTDFMTSAACLAMTPEACVVLVNMQFAKHQRKHPDHSVSWGYSDGPIHMNKSGVSRGVFTLIRLGVISMRDPGSMKGGKFRKARYVMAGRWASYDPRRPGAFILTEPGVSEEWKRCFNSDASWADGINPRIAPLRPKPKPIGFFGGSQKDQG